MAFLGGQLRLRQVTRLSDDGHHTPIITARRDLPDIQVAYRMFERWCQENVFKYLREEYALDALADHQLEPADPDRSVPNPARYALDRKLRLARLALQRLASQYGLDALGNVEAKRRTMRGFTIAASTAGRAGLGRRPLRHRSRTASGPRAPEFAASHQGGRRALRGTQRRLGMLPRDQPAPALPHRRGGLSETSGQIRRGYVRRSGSRDTWSDWWRRRHHRCRLRAWLMTMR